MVPAAPGRAAEKQGMEQGGRVSTNIAPLTGVCGRGSLIRWEAAGGIGARHLSFPVARPSAVTFAIPL